MARWPQRLLSAFNTTARAGMTKQHGVGRSGDVSTAEWTAMGRRTALQSRGRSPQGHQTCDQPSAFDMPAGLQYRQSVVIRSGAHYRFEEWPVLSDQRHCLGSPRPEWSTVAPVAFVKNTT